MVLAVAAARLEGPGPAPRAFRPVALAVLPRLVQPVGAALGETSPVVHQALLAQWELALAA